MTDTVVTQEAREAAWALRPECYQDEHRAAWMGGVYDRCRAVQAFAKFEQAIRTENTSATEPVAWQDINSAPYDTPVEVKVGSMTFLARLLPDASMSSLDETCDQWQAEIDGEHPPCWSGGACWASNENEDMSLQPTAWRTPTPPEAA